MPVEEPLIQELLSIIMQQKLILQYELDDDGTSREIYIGPSGLEAQYVWLGDWDQRPRRYIEFFVDSRVQPLTWDGPIQSPHTS